jgi:hypothetical protein
VLDAYDVFLTYVLGSAGRQTTAVAPARWQAFERALDGAPPGRYPALRRAAPRGTARDDDTRFAGGLDLVLDASRAARRASRRRALGDAVFPTSAVHHAGASTDALKMLVRRAPSAATT